MGERAVVGRVRTSFALLAALAAAASHADAQGAAACLERARAPRSAQAPAQVEGRGTVHTNGLDGPLRIVLAADGAFRVETDTALPQAIAFDGKSSWSRDHSGLERRLALEEADRSKVLAWVLSGRWSAPGVLAVRALDGAGAELELAVPGTPMVMTLTLDPATCTPAKLAYLDSSGPVVWTFSDWRDVGGQPLPHRWTFDEGSGLDTFAVESWKAVPRDASAFHSEVAPPDGVHFDPEVDAELDVVRVGTGHLLVEPWIEGESVGMFIFDTGAGAMTIDPAVADELGLPELGEVVAVGIGGRTSASFRRGTHFELGPLVLDDPVYVELDLAFLTPVFGCKVAGIVGYDLLARCVAEIETRTPRIALHDPAKYALAGAQWQELLLNGNTPSVRARFEGDRDGLFRLDTGANGTVAFHAPTVKALGMLDGRTVTSVDSGGVGGQSETKSGRIGWFELAGHRFENPVAQFSLADKGAFTDRYTAGNIGQDFLAPFRLVLDYPHERIAFAELGK